jgi:predicted RNA binding protein YcfA (HicA-like mRNA interferase family)
MSKLPSLKAREVIKVVSNLGYYKDRQKGSHATFRHRKTGHSVTIPIHKGKTLDKGLLHGIISDLDLTDEEFLKLLKKRKPSG